VFAVVGRYVADLAVLRIFKRIFAEARSLRRRNFHPDDREWDFFEQFFVDHLEEVLNGVGGAVVAVQHDKTNIEGEIASGHPVDNGECDEGLAIPQFEKRIGLPRCFLPVFENFHHEIDLDPGEGTAVACD
jgi:hypothetical protein